MNNTLIEDCIQDLIVIFKSDLKNEYTRLANKIYLKTKDGSNIKIEVKQIM